MPVPPPVPDPKLDRRRRPLACLAALLLFAVEYPALAIDDPWATGCEGCTVTDPPPYMAAVVAGFTAAAEREGIGGALAGPACRAVEAGDWSICRFAQAGGCGSLDIAGQHGALSIMSLGVLLTQTCTEAMARALQRASVHGLVRCRDDAATEAAVTRLLESALDLSTPEKAAAFEAAHVSGEPLPVDLDIAAVCGTMGGARIIEPAEGGTRETITIRVRAE